MTRIAINGFGRIGEMLLRSVIQSPKGLEVVAINDIINLDQVAYLLKFDSVHQNPPEDVECGPGWLRVGDREIKVFQERSPRDLPWGDLGIDVAVECTGVFTDREGLEQHREAGAKKVVLSAPAKGEGADITVCMGVNHAAIDIGAHNLISNASCTTNCLAPVVKVIDAAFGWRWGLMTTAHAYTGSQALIDSAQRRMRRGRAAALNIVPTTTGAAKATTEVLPHLEGKIDGMALRVPVPCGSIIDVVFESENPLSKDALHDAFRDAAENPDYRGVIDLTEQELVSTDIVGSSLSALVDGSSTLVLDDHRAKVLAWYDNEWGYACRCRDLAAYLGEAMGD